MKLTEVIDLCSLLTLDAWKYDDGKECKYNDGKLYIVNITDGYLREKEILASFEGEQFLWYRENYANSKYLPNRKFENYIESDKFTILRAKSLLLS